jgi:hypothetical protein
MALGEKARVAFGYLDMNFQTTEKTEAGND